MSLALTYQIGRVVSTLVPREGSTAVLIGVVPSLHTHKEHVLGGDVVADAKTATQTGRLPFWLDSMASLEPEVSLMMNQRATEHIIGASDDEKRKGGISILNHNFCVADLLFREKNVAIPKSERLEISVSPGEGILPRGTLPSRK